MATAEGLRVVDLDRPKALNCLDPPMLGTLLPLLLDWQQPGSEVKLVALRGTGPQGQAFCAGSNLRFLHDCAVAGELPPGANPVAGPPRLHAGIADAFLGHLYAVVRAIAAGRPPVLALCDGLVMGSGLSLAMHSTMSVVTENTLVALPETGLGGFPAAGASYTLPRLNGPAASAGPVRRLGLGTYIALAGPRLSGRDAVAAGE
jgi:enoyl-CoA hydratase/carnithine racemase